MDFLIWRILDFPRVFYVLFISVPYLQVRILYFYSDILITEIRKIFHQNVFFFCNPTGCCLMFILNAMDALSIQPPCIYLWCIFMVVCGTHYQQKVMLKTFVVHFCSHFACANINYYSTFCNGLLHPSNSSIGHMISVTWLFILFMTLLCLHHWRVMCGILGHVYVVWCTMLEYRIINITCRDL